MLLGPVNEDPPPLIPIFSRKSAWASHSHVEQAQELSSSVRKDKSFLKLAFIVWLAVFSMNICN